MRPGVVDQEVVVQEKEERSTMLTGDLSTHDDDGVVSMNILWLLIWGRKLHTLVLMVRISWAHRLASPPADVEAVASQQPSN